MSIESDVTAIRAVERRNQERELLLHEMEEAGAIGGWALDVATGRLEWTDHTRRIHGVGPDFTPTLENALNFYPEPVRDRVRQAVHVAIASGQSWEIEEPFIKATGQRIWVRAMGRVQTRNGKVHRLYGAVQDITASKARESELAAAREAAEAANRAKSAFLANMSHEIRTPLTAVLGFSEVLLDSLPAADTTQQEIVRGIQRAGSHLLTVINDVLDLSKIEADRMTVEDVPTPIAGLLDEAVDLLRPRARQKGLDLAVTLLTPLPENILSDPTRIRQIIINLLGNALKFTENGRVDLRAAVVGEPHAQRLQIEVEDQGPGMTPEQAARLFSAFTQADATVTRKHGGTGLGLMISRKLAELLGGELVLTRTAPGQGACFRLTLPLRIAPGSAMVHAARGPTPAAVSAPAAQPLAGRILLAEDGPDNQRIIAHHLRRAGATVDIVGNGVEALATIRRARASLNPYDLLITDMQMPEMDGYTLAAELRAAGEWMPIIALTAHAMADDRDRCLRAGCSDYASKPIDRERLLAACRRWLARSAPSRAA